MAEQALLQVSALQTFFKTEEGTDNAAQTSELRLAPNGDIRKYEWKEISPGTAQAPVSRTRGRATSHWSQTTWSSIGAESIACPFAAYQRCVSR